tara:strand:- start:144 stop:371 length:228 start_codon:yes stop_codon:yes gene_type:complete
VFVCIFLLFQFTVGYQLKKFQGRLEQFKSKENIENVKNKLREEMKNAVKKENYLNEEDAKLINQFINKIRQELSK